MTGAGLLGSSLGRLIFLAVAAATTAAGWLSLGKIRKRRTP
jgi:hypothetical protein